MVTVFRRTLSLSTGSQPNSPRPRADKPYHVRSTSLPCRSHPIVSQLEDQLRALRAWHCSDSGSSISAGLDTLEHLHASLADLLALPTARDSLRRLAASGPAEKTVDDFLRLADAHCTFRSAILSLKEHESAAQVALRRGDEVAFASSVRSRKQTEKELVKLASSLRDVARSSPAVPGPSASSFEDAELAGIMREVVSVTAMASASVFLGMVAVSSAVEASHPSSRASWVAKPLRKLSPSSSFKKEEEESCRRNSLLVRLEEVEECIGVLEGRNDRLFRCLVNTRVTLLNLLTI